MHLLQEDIKKIIADSGLVKEKDFLAAQEEAERSNRTPLDVLIGKGFIDEKYLTESIAKFFEVPVVNLSGIKIPAEILELVPESYAKSRQGILFEFNKEAKIGKLAMTDPEDF